MGTKQLNVFPRRNFLNAFISEMAVYFRESKGLKQVQLNRISELPEDTIKEIRPVYFNNIEWKLYENKLLKRTENENVYAKYKEFSENELFIIERFNRSEKLIEIGNELSIANNLESEDAYNQVRLLFFQMVELLVYHPLEQYDFD